MKRLPQDTDLARIQDVRSFPRVRITWRDSTSQRGWVSVEELRRDPMLCQEIVTEGRLLRRTKDSWLVAGSASSGGKVCDAMAIPAGCVTRVERL